MTDESFVHDRAYGPFHWKNRIRRRHKKSTKIRLQNDLLVETGKQQDAQTPLFWRFVQHISLNNPGKPWRQSIDHFVCVAVISQFADYHAPFGFAVPSNAINGPLKWAYQHTQPCTCDFSKIFNGFQHNRCWRCKPGLVSDIVFKRHNWMDFWPARSDPMGWHFLKSECAKKNTVEVRSIQCIQTN